jgi:GntR family transcriptional regulator/MocR family aminotransferase
MELLLNLNPGLEMPMHRQIYEEIRGAILSGRLPAKHKMPSTRQLSQTLGVSRATVTMSYEYLLSEGYLQAYTGSGTYVSRELPEDLLHVDQEVMEEQLEASPALPEGNVKHKRLSTFGRTLASEDMPRLDQDPNIRFDVGRPDMDHFPMRLWTQLTVKHANNKNLSLLDHASRSTGFRPLREALAEYLNSARALTCSAEQIVIVNGSQQGIDLVTRVLVDKDDYVGIEEPGYIGAQKSFRAQSAKLVPITVDNFGLKVDEVKKGFDKNSPQQLKLVYVTPSHQYPTGVVMSLPRRLELLKWASRTGTYIVEDDYDSEFRYKGRPIPALGGLDKTNSVIYIGTFSKMLLPALRLGYMVVPEDLIDVFAHAKWLCDRHSPLLQQQVLAEFIAAGHLERHIRKMRGIYEQRRKFFIQHLKETFGSRVTIHGDNAGINVLVRFDTTCSDEEIVSKALERGVGLSSTRQYYLGEHRPGEYHLNYGGLNENRLMEGISVLAEIVLADSSSPL